MLNLVERMDSSVLVSVMVPTYNSADTVLETLDSIKAQTYSNIELIISDDCSKDDTVERCRDWLERNYARFVRAELITVEHNTGVCANCNRMLKAATGEWRKGIAGDDILLPNCIADFVDYAQMHPEASIISSYVGLYDEIFDEKHVLKHEHVMSRDFFEKTAEEQLRLIVTSNVIFAPSLFIKMSVLNEIGGYDESLPYEDHPFYISAFEHGYKCYFMEKETVGYRRHQSMSQSSTMLFNYDFELKVRAFRDKYCAKYWNDRILIREHKLRSLQDFFYYHNLNKRTPFLEFLYKKISAFFFHIYR